MKHKISKLSGIKLEISLMIQKHSIILICFVYHYIMDLTLEIMKEFCLMEVRVCSLIT